MVPDASLESERALLQLDARSALGGSMALTEEGC